MRAKQVLPPAGGHQNLSKKMPKDTRYKGESHPAGDLEARYQEHMAKQRAAAAMQSRPETGSE
jgi:hypothetical protein